MWNVNVERQCGIKKRGDYAMSEKSKVMAGRLLIVLPLVMWGGVSILSLLINDPAYAENQLRQDLWRAGHSHAGVFLVLSLVSLLYVDKANLSPGWMYVARNFIPISAIVMPAGFFLSVLSPDATEPNALIYLTYIGAILLMVGVLTLGIGLVRGPSLNKK
jgi:hypothetical protein